MKKKFSLMIGGVVLALIICLISGIYVTANHYYSKIETTESLTLEEVAVVEEVKDKGEELGIVNIALLGIDKRSNGEDGRSDAMKVVSLDFKNKTVKMTSFQRDVLIYMPEPRADFHKMNHAYLYGGAALTLKTLNYNYDLDVTRYAAFNFDAIEAIIDIMGGVELNIKSSEIDVTNNYIKHLNSLHDDDVDASYLTKSGVQQLTGRQAMAYMRNRYVGSDFARMERQLIVIKALIEKATKLSYQELLTLLNTCLPYIETNLSLNDIISYGTKVLTFDLKNIEQLQVPSNGYDDINHSVSYQGFSPLYVMNSYQQLVKEIHEFIYNDTQYQPSQTVIETEAAIYDKFGYVK